MTISQYTQVQGDSVFALAASAGTLYAARASGLYRSDDDGQSWHDALASLERSERFAVTALAAAGRAVFAGATGAVLRSEDAGERWQVVALSSPPPSIVALAVSPDYEADGIVAAGTADDGVFISTDRGISWIPWNYGLVDLHVNALAFSPDFRRDRAIWAATESGVFRSHNAGRSWRETPFPVSGTPVLSLAVSPSGSPDGRLYAGTERHGLFVSDDAGRSWEQSAAVAATTAVSTIQSEGTNVWLLLDDALHSLTDGIPAGVSLPFPPGRQAMALLPPGVSGAALVGFVDGEILRLR